MSSNVPPCLILLNSTIIQAKARIQWLEDIITANLPDVDLSTGPQVEFDGADVVAQPETSNRAGVATAQDQASSRSPGTNKRSHASIAQDDGQQFFNSEARSVALDLGRLSLNADSREKHYLGSSSGLIFSYLIGTPPSTADESAKADSVIDMDHKSRSQRTFEIYHRLLVAVSTSLALKYALVDLNRACHPEMMHYRCCRSMCSIFILIILSCICNLYCTPLNHFTSAATWRTTRQ